MHGTHTHTHTHTEREREIHYILSSHLGADQMCRGSFLGTLNRSHHAHHIILPHEQSHSICLRTLKEMRPLVTQILQCKAFTYQVLLIPNGLC